MPVGAFFADFLCREPSWSSSSTASPTPRAPITTPRATTRFASHGYRVLRFANAEVLHDPHGGAVVIAEEIARLAGR